MKLKVGDKVVVITGKHKGKTGEIMKLIRKDGKAVVKGVNLMTRHIKAAQGRPGQKVQFEAPLDASNLMALCPKTNKRTRIGYRTDKDGKKERYAKVSQETLDTKAAKN